MKDIILFGIQGSGKGTQARKLLEKFGSQYAYFEGGDIFRALMKTPNAIGDYLNKTINNGLLVNDNVVNGLFDVFYATLDDNQNMILDGFPRKPFQMYLLLDKLHKYKREFIAINFDLSFDDAVERLTSRVICKECRTIFNTKNLSNNEVCPKCGGQLIKRNDDSPDLIKRRIQIFENETMPVIKHFEEIGKLTTINANQSEEEIFNELLKLVSE